MSAIASLSMINLDSNDPKGLTEFWAEVLGWKVAVAEDDYGMLTSDTGTSIGFGRIDDYQPTAWPDPQGKKRFHFDLHVKDRAAAEKKLEALGAKKADEQPDAEKWTVMLDPQGHPFCVVPEQS